MNAPTTEPVKLVSSSLARSRSRYKGSRQIIEASADSLSAASDAIRSISDASQSSLVKLIDADQSPRAVAGSDRATTRKTLNNIHGRNETHQSTPSRQAYYTEDRPCKTITRTPSHTLARLAAKERNLRASAATENPHKYFQREGHQEEAGSSKRLADVPSKTKSANTEPSIQRSHKTASAPHKAAASTRRAFDAPVSAVNAGERFVNVEYGELRTSFSFTPDTKTLDLIARAAIHLDLDIENDDHKERDDLILLDSFQRLGLARPVRSYENVRAVVNSWDCNLQNALLLTKKTNFNPAVAYSVDSTNRRQTTDVCVSLYHSQRPGHWEKRALTLRPDGQILILRKDGSMNLCHLSEFDLYFPIKPRISKGIKLPKRHRFALKSQQKLSIFQSTENYVHFFCTSDLSAANAWCISILKWRAWYLGTVMGHDRDSMPASTLKDQDEPVNTKIPSDVRAKTQREHGSSISSAAVNENGPNDNLRYFEESVFRRDCEANQECFSSNGLLGRTYTQLKKAQEQKQPSDASVASNSFGEPAILAHRQFQRRAVPETPTPLLDLRSIKQELLHHCKGRGVKPDGIHVGRLVEAATTPQSAMAGPGSNSRVTGSVDDGSYSSASIASQARTQFSASDGKAVGITHSQNHNHMLGLIHRGSPSQGNSGHGHGICTGDRNAKKPLVSIEQCSQYAPGSLLAQVEQRDGGRRIPAIERERTEEVEVSIGEEWWARGS